MKEPKAGEHGFAGSYAPGGTCIKYFTNETFSLGVFEWLPKSGGKGFKHSAVKVRVSGRVGDETSVFDKAREIAGQLDAGTYTGPKNVTVKITI